MDFRVFTFGIHGLVDVAARGVTARDNGGGKWDYQSQGGCLARAWGFDKTNTKTEPLLPAGTASFG